LGSDCVQVPTPGSVETLGNDDRAGTPFAIYEVERAAPARPVFQLILRRATS
jgi:hypothetical protein